MPFVLDASVTATWCFEDERDQDTDALLESLIGGESAHVPALWHWEVANLFAVGLRRTRLQMLQVDTICAMLEGLPIITDVASQDHAWRSTVALAQTHRLSAYDASYLDLALRLGLPLATKDIALAKAAERSGVGSRL